MVARRDDAAAGRRGCRRRPRPPAPGPAPGTSVRVAGRLGRDADDMHIVLDRLPGGLGRRLEQRADIDIEADIGESGGDDLSAAVMPVLAHLADQHARPPALGLGEAGYVGADPLEAGIALPGPRHRRRRRTGPPPGAGPRRPPWRPRPRPTVARARIASTASASRLPSPEAAAAVTASSAARQAAPSREARTSASRAACMPRTLALSMSRISTSLSLRRRVFVDADHHILAAVDARLAPGRGLLDAQFRHAGLDRPRPCRPWPRPRRSASPPRPRASASGSPHNSCRPADRRCGRCRPPSARISWVLRAIRAEKGVGSAIASSSALVWSDWVPPSVAASASIVVRTTLL